VASTKTNNNKRRRSPFIAPSSVVMVALELLGPEVCAKANWGDAQPITVIESSCFLVAWHRRRSRMWSVQEKRTKRRSSFAELKKGSVGSVGSEGSRCAANESETAEYLAYRLKFIVIRVSV
jgi:hypothetical protein